MPLLCVNVHWRWGVKSDQYLELFIILPTLMKVPSSSWILPPHCFILLLYWASVLNSATTLFHYELGSAIALNTATTLFHSGSCWAIALNTATTLFNSASCWANALRNCTPGKVFFTSKGSDAVPNICNFVHKPSRLLLKDEEKVLQL